MRRLYCFHPRALAASAFFFYFAFVQSRCTPENWNETSHSYDLGLSEKYNHIVSPSKRINGLPGYNSE